MKTVIAVLTPARMNRLLLAFHLVLTITVFTFLAAVVLMK